MMQPYQNFAPDDLYGAIAEQNRGRIPPQAARDWFISNGVPPINLVKTWLGYYDMVLHDDVVFLDNGCFEFSRYREGKADAALTFVCWSQDGVAEDVCAWQATTGKIATWLGHSWMLGEDNLRAPRLDNALMVHADPLEWFKANRSGIVILDRDRAAPLLREAGTLAVGSLEAAKKLKKALTVKLPTIFIPAEATA
jgi:hypothetical protein